MAQHAGNHQAQDRVAIISGLRTPFARQFSELQHLPAVELGKLLVSEMIQRHDLAHEEIDQLVFGQVLQSTHAPNIAREIVLGSGMSLHTDAYSVTRACATSFQSVANLSESILSGRCNIGIAGGADSASVLPVTLSSELVRIGLQASKAKTWRKKMQIFTQLSKKHFRLSPPSAKEYSTGLTMGETAEQMAKSYGISRTDQDNFALRSHQLAAQAWKEGHMQQQVMTTYPTPFKRVLAQDNMIRESSKLSDYSKLSPVFDRQSGSVTAGNSSGLTDGAAAVLLMKESVAKSLGYKPLGYIRDYAFSASQVEKDMLLGPAFATPKVLARTGMALNDFTLIEMHEAFSAQVLTNLQLWSSQKFAQEKLGRDQAIGDIDPSRFNVQGGSIAYGHPFAATGARIITQSLTELNRRGGGSALLTACAAGGLGAAMIVESA